MAAMTVVQLKELVDSGQFHHATYRDLGTLWEGLWIYRKEDNGFNGFTVHGSFLKASPELKQAEDFLRQIQHGVSLGAFGQG